MKKYLILFISIIMLFALPVCGAEEITNITWENGTDINADGSVLIGEKLTKAVSFPTLTKSSVIEFNYEYENGFSKTGNISYNLFADNAERFRTTFYLNGSVADVDIYRNASTSYDSYSLTESKGKIQYIVNLERKKVMIKHINPDTNETKLLTDDYIWGKDTAGINKFKIGTGSNPGVKVSDFKIIVPDSIEEYYNFEKSYNFENFELSSDIVTCADFERSSSGVAKIATDPKNSRNKVVEFKPTGAGTVVQIRPTLKEYGFSGNTHLSYRVYFTEYTSVRPPHVYQFGGFMGDTAVTNMEKVLEVIATGGQFEAKTTGDNAKLLSSRALEKWYTIDINFDSDNNTVDMYVTDEDGIRKTVCEEKTAVDFDFVNNLQFATNTDATTYYIDDIVLRTYVPLEIYSDVYDINEEALTITGLAQDITVGEFLSGISSPNGVVTRVKNQKGEVKQDSETLILGDSLRISEPIDGGVRIYSLPDVKAAAINCNIASEVYEIKGNSILGTGRNMEVSELISNIEYSIDDVLEVYSKNGILRDDKLQSGDYLLVTNGRGITRFELPDLKKNAVCSQYISIDNEGAFISNVPYGFSGNDIALALDNTDFASFSYYDADGQAKELSSQAVNGDIFGIIFDGEEYKYSLYLKNEQSLIIKDDFDEPFFKDFYTTFEPTIENSTLKLSDVKYMYPEARRYFSPVNKKLVIECSAVFNINSDGVVYNIPYFTNDDGVLGRIKVDNKKLYYGGFNRETKEVFDLDSKITIENGKKYFMKIVIDTESKSYKFYVDDKYIDSAYYPENLTDINCIKFSMSTPSTTGLNNVYIDDLRVYEPSAKIGNIYYDSSDNTVKVIFSKNDYEAPEIADITFELYSFDGTKINYSYSYSGNICTLTPDIALKDGGYSVVVGDLKSVSSDTAINKTYLFTKGNPDYKINYVSYRADSDGFMCELGVDNKTQVSKEATLYFALFDENRKLIKAISSDKLLNEYRENGIYVFDSTPCEGVSYVKVFLWDNNKAMHPLSLSYIK